MDKQIQQSIDAEIEKHLRIALAKEDYLYFLDYVENYGKDKPQMLLPRYVQFIAKTLDNAIKNQHDQTSCKKYIVSLPVQHGKSFLLSEHLLAYLALTRKRYNSLLVTYSSTLSEDIGLKNRELIERYGNDFGRKLSDSSGKKNRYNVEYYNDDGSYGGVNQVFATTILGKITGYPSDLTIIDDMYSDLSEVYGKVGETKYNAFLTKVLTRKSAHNITVVVMSRWSDDDMVGKVLDEQGHYDRENNINGWTEIRIPAIATAEDSIEWVEKAIGRSEGQSLGEHIGKGKDFYEMQRKDMGDTFYRALFQQNPSALVRKTFDDEKLHFNTLKYLDENEAKENGCKYIMTCDLASSDKIGSDESAFALIRMQNARGTSNDIEVLAMYSGVHNINEMQSIFYKLYYEWDTEYGLDYCVIENKSNGIPLLQTIRDNNRKISKGEAVYETSYVPLKQVFAIDPTLSKLTRLMYLAQENLYINAGKIVNPLTNEFGLDYEKVIKSQTKLTTKVDIIDAIAMAYIALRDAKMTDSKLRYQKLARALA